MRQQAVDKRNVAYHNITQESLANAKVSARVRDSSVWCVYEGPYRRNLYGLSMQRTYCLKVHLVGYNAVADDAGLSWFVQQLYSTLLPPKSAKFREILQKVELIAVQDHPRSSILVPIESATSY